MAVTRPLKEGSVTTYQQKVALGFPDILASEMDADLDTIYAAWNGNVGTANLVDGAVTYAKLAPDAQLWRDTGAVLTPGPNFTNRGVTIGGGQFQAGAAPLVGRLNCFGGTDGRIILAANDPFAPPDATKPSWMLYLDPNGDAIIGRRPANAASGATTNQFVCRADGKTVCTLADNSVTRPMLAPASTLFRAQITQTFAYAANSNISSTAGMVIVRGTITTSGGQVMVVANLWGKFYPNVTGVNQIMYYRLQRDGGGSLLDHFVEAEIPAGSFAHGFPATQNLVFLDNGAAAGAHTYEVAVYVGSASNVYHTGLYLSASITGYEFV